MFGGGAKPQVPVQAGGRLACGGKVTVARYLAIAPGSRRLQFANGAVEDHLLDPGVVRLGMHLGAALGGELALVGEPVLAQQPRLLDAEGERFFTVNTQATVESPIGDEGVVMVGSGDDQRIEILLIKALAPVGVGLRLGKFLERQSEVFRVDVTEGDHVFLGNPAMVGETAPPDADKRDVEFVVGGLTAKDARGQKRKPGGGEAGLGEEAAAIHDGLVQDANYSDVAQQLSSSNYVAT